MPEGQKSGGGEGAATTVLPPSEGPGLAHLLLGPPGARQPTVRGILRIVVTVAAALFAFYVLYRLRTPISYVLMAGFLAVVLSGPVTFLSRRMPKGLSIALVYFALILVPFAIGGILIPPLVRAASALVAEFPGYVHDLRGAIENNSQLQSLNENFNLTGKLEEFATDAAGRLDDAAAVLTDLGAGLVGSLFALVTIVILSIFMVSRGGAWINRALELRRPEEADVIKRALDHMAVAVGGYVGGALLQAFIAATVAFGVLELLGVPSPLALAVIIFVLDLIPLVGATIGAVLVGVVTLFVAFPTTTIIWAVFAIVYQQFENYVVQPRIQGRAVQLDPFIIVVAALFGGTLLGIVGALVAIPVAAATQIAVREYIAYRNMTVSRQLEQTRSEAGGSAGQGEQPPADGAPA